MLEIWILHVIFHCSQEMTLPLDETFDEIYPTQKELSLTFSWIVCFVCICGASDEITNINNRNALTDWKLVCPDDLWILFCNTTDTLFQGEKADFAALESVRINWWHHCGNSWLALLKITWGHLKSFIQRETREIIDHYRLCQYMSA